MKHAVGKRIVHHTCALVFTVVQTGLSSQLSSMFEVSPLQSEAFQRHALGAL